MNIADTIQKVKEAGFHLAVDGDDIIVTPPGKLSDQQRDYRPGAQARDYLRAPCIRNPP